MAERVETFGRIPGGDPVERVTLTGGGLTAKILTYGATLQDLRMVGVDHSLVLGAPTLEPYFGPFTYFGALVGRFANRIAHGRFSVDDEIFQVPTNWLDRHALHGGPVGTGQRLWQIGSVTENSLRLELVLPDGEMGFPGTMRVNALVSLPGDGAMQFETRAEADAATPCSFAHHSFFNLDGTADITGHELQIEADAYLPVDSELIPTGEVAAVAGTPFDFRRARRIGRGSVDHNFCLSDGRRPLRPVAALCSPASGLSLAVETTEPGLQVYDGAYLPPEGVPGLDGRRYGPFAGIALETQSWPDAPNRPAFPSAVLCPGQTYHHCVRYVFRKGGDRF